MSESSAPARKGRPGGEDRGEVVKGRGLVRLTVALLARTVLFSILGSLTWALLPVAIGWSPTTVVTGSMLPRIYAGDVVVTRPIPAGTASLGQILLVDDPDHPGRLRLHRYVEAAPDGNLILRGDANPANDSSPVTADAVHGVAVLRIPFAGMPVVWWAERAWGMLGALVAAVAGLTVAAASGSNTARFPDDAGKPSGMPRPPVKPPRARVLFPRRRASARTSLSLRSLLALAAVPVLLWPGLLMSAPAHARFSASAPSPTSSFSAVANYPCLAPALTNSPSLFYGFNEGSGTVATDASANRQDGTLRGTTSRVPGSCRTNSSPALTLGGSPGTEGYVSSPRAVSAPNTFTVEIWFNATTTAAGKLIGLGSAQTGNSAITDRHLYMTDAGQIAFGLIVPNGNSYKGVAIVSLASYRGAWHHAAATVSSTGATLYVDGEPVVSSGTLVAQRSYSGYWRVGNDTMDLESRKREWAGVTGDPFFTGSVDNAAVYPTALTAIQVQALFDAGR